MKRKLNILITLIVVFSFFSFTYNLSYYIELYLKEAKTGQDIQKLYSILNDKVKDYPQHFDFVPTINPVNPKKLKRYSSSFGMRFHPVDGKDRMHLGLDISASLATPVHAAADGKVTTVIISDYGYGNQVIIKHKFGFSTRYAHMTKVHIQKNDSIKKGDIIGFIGSTGKSTGYHLHYEVLKYKKPIDPYPFCFIE